MSYELDLWRSKKLFQINSNGEEKQSTTSWHSQERDFQESTISTHSRTSQELRRFVVWGKIGIFVKLFLFDQKWH